MNRVEINDINDSESLDVTWIPKIIKFSIITLMIIENRAL